MKRIGIICGALSLLLASCSGGMQGNPTGVMLGAQVGGMIGGLAGDIHGRNYTGRMLGSIIGTITGAAVGNILTTPQGDEEEYSEDFPGTSRTEVDFPHRPSRLSIRKIRFVDADGDHVIETGESCQLIFLVMNKGNAPIYNITPIVEEVSGMKHLYISPTVSVERILPGEGIKYTANIRAGKRIKTGEATFRIYALEGSGASSTVKEFSLQTRKVKR